MTHDLSSVAVIGAGLIGRSWAALFLAKGLDVRVMDARPEVEADLLAFVESTWPTLRALDLAEDEEPRSFDFTTDIETACRDADFVQENGPESLELKHDVYRVIEGAVEPTTVIASSTSSLRATDLQKGARHPERILVGHPMNPPHLVPLVEIIGGEQTSADAVARARAFYESLGRDVIVAKKEAVGHIANRLTSALYREAVNLVAEGIATVEDVDRAIASGPGLRWALMGPHLTYHLGGGEGGYRHYLDHLGPAQEARWKTLGNPTLTDELKDELIAGVDEVLEKCERTDLVDRRDKALVEILRIRKRLGF